MKFEDLKRKHEYGGLDKSHTDDIYDYSFHSAPINAALHAAHDGGGVDSKGRMKKQKPLSKQHQKVVDKTDALFDEGNGANRIKKDAKLYHGLRESPQSTFDRIQKHEGGEARPHIDVHCPAYISATHDEKVAHNFTYTHKNAKDKHILEIETKKGQNAIPLNDAARYDNERETLIKRKAKLRIHANPRIVEHPNGKRTHYWRAELLGHDE